MQRMPLKFIADFKSFDRLASLRHGLILGATLLAFIATLFDGFSFALLAVLVTKITQTPVPAAASPVGVGGWIQSIEFIPDSFLAFVAGLGICMCSKIGLGYTANWLMSREYYRVLRQLRGKIFRAAIGLNQSSFSQLNPGHLHGLMTNSSAGMANKIREARMLLQKSASLAAYSLILFKIDPLLASLSLPLGATVAWTSKGLAERIRKSVGQGLTNESSFNGFISESFAVTPTIRQYCTHKPELVNFESISSNLSDSLYRNWLLHNRTGVMMELRSALTMLIVLGGLGFASSVGKFTFTSSIIAFVLTFYRLVGGVSEWVNHVKGVVGIRHVVQQITDLIELADKNSEIDSNQSGRCFPSFIHSLKLEDLSFGFDIELPLFKHLNLEFNAGQNIRIKGRSGIGKSTLTQVLSRLMEPHSGSILLNGYDAECYNLESWRKKVVIVSHDPKFRDATIADTVTYGLNASVTESLLYEILELVEIGYLYRSKPKDFKIGTSGSRLSHGQKLRIALAQALIRKPAVLILDEALNSVEPELANRLLKRMRLFLPDLILIVVSHNNISGFEPDLELELGDTGYFRLSQLPPKSQEVETSLSIPIHLNRSIEASTSSAPSV
jgi:ABC-type multidrug transport system fused ATPase/permease subunit